MAGRGAAPGAIKLGIGVTPAKIKPAFAQVATLATITGDTKGAILKMAAVIPELTFIMAITIMVTIISLLIITGVVTMGAAIALPTVIGRLMVIGPLMVFDQFTATDVPRSGAVAGIAAGKTAAIGDTDPGVPVGTTGPQVTGPGGAPVPWAGG